jgi:hypothetical protein
LIGSWPTKGIGLPGVPTHHWNADAEDASAALKAMAATTLERISLARSIEAPFTGLN